MNPLNIYLDQNIYGHLLDVPDWHAHPIAQVLIEASKQNRGYVWVSPTHVVELMQVTNLPRRRALAQIMLELSGARRMMMGPEYTLVESFGAFLNDVLPGSYHSQFYVKPYLEQAQRLWLGYLALLTLDPPYELGPGIKDIRRAKLESHLLHARIAADPDDSITRIIDCASNFSTTTQSDPLELGKLTDSEIESELAKLKTIAKVPSEKTLKKVQRHRKEIAQVYGAIDIGGALQAIFGQFPMDFELTFDTRAIAKNWNAFQARCSMAPLPASISNTDPAESLASAEAAIFVINASIAAAAHVGLSVATIGYYSLLRELEVCLNQRKIPTVGSTLDVDHATAAFHCDVFACHDHMLESHVKSYVNNIGRNVIVVSKPKQLLNALGR